MSTGMTRVVKNMELAPELLGQMYRGDGSVVLSLVAKTTQMVVARAVTPQELEGALRVPHAVLLNATSTLGETQTSRFRKGNYPRPVLRCKRGFALRRGSLSLGKRGTIIKCRFFHHISIFPSQLFSNLTVGFHWGCL